MNQYDSQGRKYGLWQVNFLDRVYKETYVRGVLKGTQKCWTRNQDPNVLLQQVNYIIVDINAVWKQDISKVHGLILSHISFLK